MDDADALRRELAERGAALLRVDGACMEPAIRKGDRVAVFRDPAPRRGDGVVVSSAGRLEVHRVVDRIEMGPRVWYLHQGDASSEGGLAGPGDLVGRVAVARRPRPAPRSHLRGLLLRLGALLRRLAGA